MVAFDAVFVTSKIAKQSLQVGDAKLRQWGDSGVISVIRTLGGKRLYDVQSFINQNRCPAPSSTSIISRNHLSQERVDKRHKVCYCRVSSHGQKDDLERQIQYMRSKYPDHDVIQDIGSGINWKRKGLDSLLERSLSGTISEIVVAHRDRLCRFAFELLERIFQKCEVRILVLDQGMDIHPSGQRELADDLLAIINVFNCRVNGRRKHTKKANDKEKNRETQTERIDQSTDQAG